MIQVEQLSKSYGDRLLFQDVSFSIAEGEKCGLIAANGTGKTTLLRIITGEETPDSGTITTRKNLRIAYSVLICPRGKRYLILASIPWTKCPTLWVAGERL